MDAEKLNAEDRLDPASHQAIGAVPSKEVSRELSAHSTLEVSR